MKKNIVLFFALFVLAVSGAFSQQYRNVGETAHWVVGENGQWIYHMNGKFENCPTDLCRAQAQFAQASDDRKSFEPKISGRNDPMGLEKSAVDVQSRIPIVVGEAVGMNSVNQYYSRFFGGGWTAAYTYPQYNFYDQYGDLGRAIQREASTKLFGIGYSVIAPETGAMNHDTQIVRREVSFRQAAPLKRQPEYVVVLAYGILNEATSGLEIDFRQMAWIAQAVLGYRNYRTAQIVSAVGNSTGYLSTRRKTEALLSVTVYTPDGQVVKHLTGTATVDYKEMRDIQFLGVRKLDVNNPSVLLLARMLVNRAFK